MQANIGPYQAARNSKLAPTECTGLRCVHERSTSACNCMPCSKAAWLISFAEGMADSAWLKTFQPWISVSFKSSAALLAHMAIRCNRTTSEAQVFAHGSCSRTSSTVAVASTARRKRNHEVNGTRRVLSGGMSPKSSTTMPNPPPCKSKSVTFRTCSSRPREDRRELLRGEEELLSLHRSHSRRSRSTPAADADAGSKLSLASTSAHASSRRVAPASAASMTPVRPEETGPVISLRAPRGNPPVKASNLATPVETVRGAAFSRKKRVEERCWPSDDSMRARSEEVDSGMEDLRKGSRKKVYFRFLFVYRDRILRPRRKVVKPSSRNLSGFGPDADNFVIMSKLPQEALSSRG